MGEYAGFVDRRRWPVAVLAAALCAVASPSGASAQGAPIPMVTYNAHWGEQVDAQTGRWTGKLDLADTALVID